MEFVSNYDFYEIRLGCILSDSDRKILIDLYQPIIGSTAISLYLKLWSDYQTDFEKGFYTIDKLINNMRITTDEFLECRRHLEALGLVKTYVKTINDEKKCYLICLYSPKQPKDFFNDYILKELFIDCVGESGAQKVINYYQINIDTSGYEDISALIGEVFFNEINKINKNPSNMDILNLKGKDSAVTRKKFDKGKFLTILYEDNYLNRDFLDDKEIENIAQIADVYDISEANAANYLSSYCDYSARKGNRLNNNKLRTTFKNISNLNVEEQPTIKKYKISKLSDSDLSDYIKLVEIKSPVEFLKYINNSMPLNADLKIIEDINSLLPAPIINVIISYTLEVCNNKLSRNFVESVVDQIRREGINTAIDAINFLCNEAKRLKNFKQSTSSNFTSNYKIKKRYENDDAPVEYREDLEDEDE